MLTYTTTYPSDAALRIDPDCPNTIWTECECGMVMKGYRKECDCQHPLWCEHFEIVCPNEGRGNTKFVDCRNCNKFAVSVFRNGCVLRRLK